MTQESKSESSLEGFPKHEDNRAFYRVVDEDTGLVLASCYDQEEAERLIAKNVRGRLHVVVEVFQAFYYEDEFCGKKACIAHIGYQIYQA